MFVVTEADTGTADQPRSRPDARSQARPAAVTRQSSRGANGTVAVEALIVWAHPAARAELCVRFMASKIVSETVSGSSAIEQRPGFIKLLNKLEQDDVLIVTKLDRLQERDRRRHHRRQAGCDGGAGALPGALRLVALWQHSQRRRGGAAPAHRQYLAAGRTRGILPNITTPMGGSFIGITLATVRAWRS
jgi:Resolvase, N terminal domain